MADDDRISKMQRTVQQANQRGERQGGFPVFMSGPVQAAALVPRFYAGEVIKPIARAIAPETTKHMLEDPEATGVRKALRNWYTSPRNPMRAGEERTLLNTDRHWKDEAQKGIFESIAKDYEEE